jgi:fused signal recognition particle receptor
MGFFDRIKQSLTRTKEQFVERFEEVVKLADEPAKRSQPIDVETVEALEEALISADVGVAATDQIVAAVRAKRERGESLRTLVKEEIRGILSEANLPAGNGHRPHVVLIVGVNGTGKTTTVGKLRAADEGLGQYAAHLRGRYLPRGGGGATRDLGDARRRGHHRARKPARTRRQSCSMRSLPAKRASATSSWSIPPAASTHGEPDDRAREDPTHRRARGRRGAARGPSRARRHRRQNGLAQAREFMNVAGVNGIVLTKLDGTAKGGIAVAIAHDLKLPIRYVGVGETIDDLIPFSPDEYVDALFEEKW